MPRTKSDGSSLRRERAIDPSRSIRRAALKIISHGLHIHSLSWDRSGAGFRSLEHGHLTHYSVSEQNIYDVLWQRYRYWPRRRAAVREAVRILEDRARREGVRCRRGFIEPC